MYQSTCTPAFGSLCWSFRANFASSPAPIPEQGFRHEGAGNTPSREESQSQSALITSHGMGSSIILEWQAGCGAHLLASRPPIPFLSISP